jgi:HK97 family phage major capsid protein
MGVNSQANDAMIRRLENELNERNAFVQGLIANVQDRGDDLNDTEKASLTDARQRMGVIKDQIDQLEDTARVATEIATRAKQVDQAITVARRNGEAGPVEYKTTGAYMLDYINAQTGGRAAKERLELYTRAAAHQKTSDNLGVIPDPIVGDVVNFIDAARPLVSFLGPRNMPSQTWYRPKVTAHTLVDQQGTLGAAADEKTELVSQKMTIGRLTGTAVTYGGYVNVSRQNVDFSSPDALDIVVGDLAAQYAIETEAATGVLVQAQANNVELAPVAVGNLPSAAELVAALWTAVGNIYTATKGAGRIALVVPPARLGNWGGLFAPVNPQNAQSTGFNAADFGQGVMGTISGVPVIVSAGYPVVANHYGSVVSSAAVEVYEQRVGALQVTEPSVLGIQVAYAGYFTPLLIETAGVQRIVNLT